jgi:hypothetical protein
MKWTYEFWGFCVWAPNSTTVPGGFAAVNGTVLPTNFTGGTGLLATGTDGYHPAVSGQLFGGDCLFSSPGASFTPSMAGRIIAIWVPGSNSSEDSLYLISRVVSSTQLVININTGGTPNPTTKHPSMTARTGVFYRILDMETGAASLQTAAGNGNFMVFQTDASSINPGQANSQIQITQIGIDSVALLGGGISGTGTWAGNSFVLSTATNATPIVCTTPTPHNFSTGQTINITGALVNTAANGSWVVTVVNATQFSLVGSVGNGAYTANSGTIWNGFQNDGYQCIFSYNPNTNQGYTAGATALTLIGDKTMLIAHIREQDVFQFNAHSSFYFEIPTRLYPQNADLHPVAFLGETGNTGRLDTQQTTSSYGGGWIMRTHPSDSTTARSYRALVKAFRGDGTPDVFGRNLTDYKIGFNTVEGTIPQSDVILCLPGITNQYSLARVKLRSVKFTGTHVPQFHRIGLNGEFLQITQFSGLCWPWDNTIHLSKILFYGT